MNRVWCSLLFLRASKVNTSFDDEEFEELVVEVAKGKKSKEEIVSFLRQDICVHD